jgi:minor extracellular serine protease Vpr
MSLRQILEALWRVKSLPLSSLFVAMFLLGIAPGFSQVVEGQYIVRLRSAPMLAGVRGAVRRNAIAGARARAADPEMERSRTALRNEQSALRGKLNARGDVRVIGQTELTLNSLIVVTGDEGLAALRQLPEVDEVYPSVMYHKTMDAALQLVRAEEAWNARTGGEALAGAGVKIAVIDTGMDINHPMLQDATLSAPPGFPKFAQSADSICVSDDRQYTNSKVIVARNYVRLLPTRDPNCDAMDRDGHGTFSSTVAAGRRVAAPAASIAGVAPAAFLGSYKVFGTPGANNSASLAAVLAALEDAVRDGMDVVNLSLGADIGLPPSADPLALAVKTAVNAGVVVVAAAGNEGTGSGTISSPGIAPEAITVGASTNSRALALQLEIAATSVVPPILQRVSATPATGVSISAPLGPSAIRDVTSLGLDSTACTAVSTGGLRGAVALIERGGCSFQTKITNSFTSGAVAVILFNNQTNQPAIGFTPGTATQIPSVMIGNSEGRALRAFLQSTAGEVSVRVGTVQQSFPAEANRVATFSSVGPNPDFALKPDLSAPGVNIYAGTQRNFAAGEQFDASGFGISQGTSVSAPMVAGAAAIIRQLWPQFTPAQVKSALVQTAADRLLARGDGVSGVMAGGNGLLDLQAAVTAPAVIVPSSISLGVNAPGAPLSRTAVLTITNAGSASDTFTIESVAVPQSSAATVSITPANVSVAVGESRSVSVTLGVLASTSGIVEGRVEVRSQSTGQALTVPYWGSFMRPVLNLTGVVNAASFTATSQRVAAGSLITIFGSDLATTAASASFLPLPTALAGVRVFINDEEAPLLFVSPTQINAQVPYELANTSLGLVRVVVHGQTTANAPVQIALAAPGIFTLNESGTGRAAALHGLTGAPVTDANPARPSEVLSVFASGLGTTSPAATSGAAATSLPLQTTTRDVTASIGGLSAPVSFSGLAPGFAGLYQINVQVPDAVASGELALVVSSADASSNAVSIPVQR